MIIRFFKVKCTNVLIQHKQMRDLGVLPTTMECFTDANDCLLAIYFIMGVAIKICR